MIYTKHVKMGITWREYANYSLFIFITIFSLIQSTNQISFILNPIEWFIEAKHSSRESDQTTKKKWIKTKRHELYYLISLSSFFLLLFFFRPQLQKAPEESNFLSQLLTSLHQSIQIDARAYGFLQKDNKTFKSIHGQGPASKLT